MHVSRFTGPEAAGKGAALRASFFSAHKETEVWKGRSGSYVALSPVRGLRPLSTLCVQCSFTWYTRLLTCIWGFVRASASSVPELGLCSPLCAAPGLSAMSITDAGDWLMGTA